MVSYFQIFLELKKVLLDAYDIDMEEAIKEVAKIIHDFKENGYDVAKIIEEYKSSQSLKWMISENEKKVKELQEQRNSLLELGFIPRLPSKHAQANHECVLGTGGNGIWASRDKTDMEHHFGDCRNQKGFHVITRGSIPIHKGH